MSSHLPAAPRIHPSEPQVTPGQLVAFEALAMLGDVHWELGRGPHEAPEALPCSYGTRTLLRIPVDTPPRAVLLLRATSLFDPALTATAILRVAPGHPARSNAPVQHPFTSL